MTNYMAVGKRNQYFLLVVFVLTIATFYYFSYHEEAMQKSTITLLKIEDTRYFKGFLVHTPGCKIPEMDPYDVSVRKFVKEYTYPACNQIPPLIESNQTSIWIVTEALRSFNISDSSELDCCYTDFWRIVPNGEKSSDYDNMILEGRNCIPFNHSANIPFEFIKIQCKLNGALVYTDFHPFIVPKNNKNDQKTNNDATITDNEVSVLIIGADSLSRLNFHRKMPKTKNFMDYLGAIEFFGYNTVQDNTFPNLVPLLSGYSVEEISFCWPEPNAYFDDCPWIWKEFKEKNYMTGFGEEACWMGIFNYNKRGFMYPPTDYYTRPYIYRSEQVIGHLKLLNSKFCIGNRYAPEVLFNYAYKFTVNMTMSKKKFWGIFWESSLTHDFLNGPSQTDDIFYNFFDKLERENVLNKTVVFFMSDHGMRWGNIRTTYQGRMEEHLPFLYIIAPDWFKERYSSAIKNVQRNRHLLTTHFDVHETMKDLLNLDSLRPESLEVRALEVADKRGYSLFLPGSINRTCESAGIKPTWCTCQQKKDVSIKDEMVKKAVEVTVSFLNNMLKSYKECAQLQLDQILAAHVESGGEAIYKKDTKGFMSDYVVTFRTVPGLAKFESVVRYRSDTSEMSVVSDISRVNLYGSQSSCVIDYKLKLYCYCI